MSSDKLSMKEMAEKFSVTPRALRHYEYIELLFPENDNGKRFYGPREVARLKLILRGRRFGFSLEETRQWLELYDKPDGEDQMEVWIKFSGHKLAELEEQKHEIEDIIEELTALRNETIASQKR